MKLSFVNLFSLRILQHTIKVRSPCPKRWLTLHSVQGQHLHLGRELVKVEAGNFLDSCLSKAIHVDAGNNHRMKETVERQSSLPTHFSMSLSSFFSFISYVSSFSIWFRDLSGRSLHEALFSILWWCLSIPAPDKKNSYPERCQKCCHPWCTTSSALKGKSKPELCRRSIAANSGWPLSDYTLRFLTRMATFLRSRVLCSRTFQKDPGRSLHHLLSIPLRFLAQGIIFSDRSPFWDCCKPRPDFLSTEVISFIRNQ